MFHEEDLFYSKSGNGTWTGMMALVSSGVEGIGVGHISVTKNRSEVVAFTDTLESLR